MVLSTHRRDASTPRKKIPSNDEDRPNERTQSVFDTRNKVNRVVDDNAIHTAVDDRVRRTNPSEKVEHIPTE